MPFINHLALLLLTWLLPRCGISFFLNHSLLRSRQVSKEKGTEKEATLRCRSLWRMF